MTCESGKPLRSYESWFSQQGNGASQPREMARQGCPVHAGARGELGRGPRPASSPPTLAIQSPPPQEAVRPRDKTRVNKLFSKTGRVAPSSPGPLPACISLPTPGKVRREAASTLARSQALGHAAAALTN